jgi:hypothetical protein
MVRGKMFTGCWWETEGKRPSGDPDVDRRVILGRIFRKLMRFVGTGWSWLRIRTGDRHL